MRRNLSCVLRPASCRVNSGFRTTEGYVHLLPLHERIAPASSLQSTNNTTNICELLVLLAYRRHSSPPTLPLSDTAVDYNNCHPPAIGRRADLTIAANSLTDNTNTAAAADTRTLVVHPSRTSGECSWVSEVAKASGSHRWIGEVYVRVSHKKSLAEAPDE